MARMPPHQLPHHRNLFSFFLAASLIQSVISNQHSQQVAVGQQLWFLSSQAGESCDQTCAKASFDTNYYNKSRPQHARSCDVSAFATISTEQVKTLFRKMIHSPACSCVVEGKTNTVAGIVPYFGGVGGADCTGAESEHGCVYGTTSNGLRLATCEASQPTIFRICPCKEICKLYFLFVYYIIIFIFLLQVLVYFKFITLHPTRA